MPAKKPHAPFIFQDPRGNRWPRFRRLIILVGLLVFISIVLFVQALLLKPDLALPKSVRHLRGELTAYKNPPPPAPTQAFKHFLQTHSTTKPIPHMPLGPKQEIRAGFFDKSNPYSILSLEKHADKLTHVCTGWMSIVDGTGRLVYDRESAVVDLTQRTKLALFPTLNNLLDNTWQPEAIENLANGPQARRDAFFRQVLHELDEIGASGLILDWEDLDPSYQDDVTQLITQMAEALHAKNRELWLSVSAGDDAKVFDLDTLSGVVDHFLATLSDEDSETDAPGPVASQDWVESCIDDLTAFGAPGQWIAALGNYGYDWASGEKTAETITFADAMSRASFSGIDDVKIEAPLYNPTFSYYEGAIAHTVWFLDGTTFLNQLQLVRKNQWGGFAINAVGSEDPAIWTLLGSKPRQFDLTAMQTLEAHDIVTNVGRGEIVSVDLSKEPGKRTITLNNDEIYTSVYTDFPTFPTLYHQGGTDPKMVSLTFDDGPDPRWTPRILDILKARGLKATFFLVGTQAEKYPGLVRRILEEGHNLGNHTYTHANLGLISRPQIELELNATQRLIESITGYSTTLFRPPYNADSQPSNIAELVPLSIAQDLNYLLVLENIDPEDWAKPGVDQIVDRVRKDRHLGNIVLLHDAGGDRSQTVEALPKIIDYLQQRGDEIVPLEKLLFMSHSDLMHKVAGDKQGFSRLVSAVGFNVVRFIAQFLWAFMIVATVLVGLRTLIIAYLAARRRPTPAPGSENFHPSVSVIIAAYNEEKVIEATLRSVLKTNYGAEFEIIVVNDGSKDATSERVRSIGSPAIRLIEQSNAGKSIALRAGIAAASSEVIIFLDADTHFEPDTIGQLVIPLANEEVGAVSGHARVGNLRSFIARCQSLEYICGFNLDRRAYSVLNCITVAPGAISAFRKSVIEEVGGISTDTLAEDTDLTLALHRSDWRVEYAPSAIAWTEAPETFRTLAKQRFRWAFGTLQCLWKHRDLVFNPRFGALGLFALPSVWFFQILLVAITPIVDFYLLVSIYLGNAVVVLPYMLVFLLTDLILAVIACRMEREPLWKAWIIIPMRFIYRPLFSWVIWKSIFQAVRGVLIGWGKLERTASVNIPGPKVS